MTLPADDAILTPEEAADLLRMPAIRVSPIDDSEAVELEIEFEEAEALFTATLSLDEARMLAHRLGLAIDRIAKREAGWK